MVGVSANEIKRKGRNEVRSRERPARNEVRSRERRCDAGK